MKQFAPQQKGKKKGMRPATAAQERKSKSRPESKSVAHHVHLQRTTGNQAVQGMIKPGTLQIKDNRPQPRIIQIMEEDNPKQRDKKTFSNPLSQQKATIPDKQKGEIAPANSSYQLTAMSDELPSMSNVETHPQTHTQTLTTIQRTKFKIQHKIVNKVKTDVMIIDIKTTKKIGQVGVQYNHSTKTVFLHTNASKGLGGKGLGGEVYNQVMTYLIKNKLIPEGYKINLAIVGGAMLHLQTRKLSERFGNISIYKSANELREKRKIEKKKEKSKSESQNKSFESDIKEAEVSPKNIDLKNFKKGFIAEHWKYLEALVEARRKGNLTELSIHAPKAIKKIKEYYYYKKRKKFISYKKIIFDEEGPDILKLLSKAKETDQEEYDALKKIYIESLQSGKGVSVTFVLSKKLLKQFIGYGILNKAKWIFRQLQLQL
jgi:hypothetical protein